MKNYADLEISLRPGEEALYAVDFRFIDPDSETDVRLEQGKPAYAKLDYEALRELQDESDEYGQALTNGLFADPVVKEAFEKARTRVFGVDGKKLRLRLTIGASAEELHNLRWETLRDPQDASPLCTNENLLFSRYLSSYDWRAVKLRPKGSLRALVVVANPSNLAENKMEPIDVAVEIERAKKALGEISVNTLPDSEGKLRATANNLINELRTNEYDILYLVAHGALVKEVPRLWLEDDEGLVANTSGSELATRIKELEQRPRLVVLASCESAGKGEGDGLSAFGPRLAEAGIPAVLAMQGKISMETSGAFMEAFFRELQRDGQIDRAAAVARGQVRTRPDFWMPVLYLRLKNGRIWYVPGFGEGREFTRWKALVAYIRNRECTPILGPGLFEPLLGSLDSIALRWSDEFQYPLSLSDRESLPRVAQFLSTIQSPQFPYQHLEEFLRKEIDRRYHADLPEKLFDPFEEANADQFIEVIGAQRRARVPEDAYKLLAQLPFRIYITANTNSLMETALREVGREPQVVLAPWNTYTEEKIRSLGAFSEPTPKKPIVYYLFGQLTEPKSMVLTEDNYFDYLLGVSRNNELIPVFVRNAMRGTSLLFIGFRMEEWNFRVLFRSIVDKRTEMMSEYVHIAAQIQPEEGRIIDPDGARRYLEEYFKNSASINLFWGSAEEFVRELWAQWNILK